MSADTGELIRKAVNEADAAFNCLTTTDVQKIATQEAIDHFVINPGRQVSVRQIQRKMLLWGLKESVGQWPAQARVRAAREIRNFSHMRRDLEDHRHACEAAKSLPNSPVRKKFVADRGTTNN